MATCEAIVTSYRDLRDSLTSLADRAADRTRAITLRQRALVAGDLAEQCDGKFHGGDVPNGDRALSDADTASTAAKAASGTDNDEVDRVIQAAGHANTTLNGLVQSGPRLVMFTDRFRGSLRVSPPDPPKSPADAHGVASDHSTTKPKDTAQPAYVASVAMLFPTEAATLFPLGQAIAGDSGIALAIVIVLILVFVVAVRFFATQEEGGSSPVKKEIFVAGLSFLLWVGSLKGYWVTRGFMPLSVDPDLGSKLFGFATIMWVAIVPYFVRKPTQAAAIAKKP